VNDRLFFGMGTKRYLSEGYVENDYLGSDDVEKRDDLSGYGNLRWTPTNAWEILFNVNATRYEDGFGGFGPLEEMKQNAHHVNLDFPSQLNNDANNQSLTINHEGEWFNLTSITAHREVDYDLDYDMDFTSVDMIRNNYQQDQNQWTQEIRLASPESEKSRLKWLIGAFYLDEDFEVDSVYDFRQYEYTTTQKSELDTRNHAFFGQATYRLRDALGITAGLRYDHDKKKFRGVAYDNPDIMGSGTTAVSTKNSLSEWLPKFAIDYRFNPNFMTYTSVSKGYTAGSFNELDASVLGVPYAAEYSWNYEAGIKSSWMNNKLIVNLSAFYIDWKDKQVFLHTGVVSNIFKNAAEATSKGFEVETWIRPLPGLDIIGGFGYTDAQYENFVEPIYDDNTGAIVGETDYSGKTLEFAPEYTYNLAVQYRYPIVGLHTLLARLENQGVGEFYFDLANEKKQESYQRVNAKLGLEGEFKDMEYSFYLWGKNIFDETYIVSAWGSDSAGWFGRAGEPRQFGATLTIRF
jgi:iron complex outermembrane receptor protein